jgi:hypothetical protein
MLIYLRSTLKKLTLTTLKYTIKILFILGARRSAVGEGTVLQAERSRV